MHLKELTYIVTLADEGSITRAADKLYMAQSSLSQFLQQYEAELGLPLFIRTSKGIRPTAAGTLFIDNVRTILTHYRLVQNELWDMAELNGGSVILGISSFRGRYMLPKILTHFYEKYPGIRVDIVEQNSMALEDRLIEGSIDLAIVALPLTRLTHEVEFIKEDEIFIVANRNHPVMKFAHKRKNSPYYWVDLKDTAPFEYILSDYDTILGSTSRRQFQKAGIKPIAYNTNITADLGVAMAQAGLGLAFTYHSCAQNDPGTEYLSIGEKGVFLELAIAHPYSTYQSKAALALGKVIKQTFSPQVPVHSHPVSAPSSQVPVEQ